MIRSPLHRPLLLSVLLLLDLLLEIVDRVASVQVHSGVFRLSKFKFNSACVCVCWVVKLERREWRIVCACLFDDDDNEFENNQEEEDRDKSSGGFKNQKTRRREDKKTNETTTMTRFDLKERERARSLPVGRF